VVPPSPLGAAVVRAYFYLNKQRLEGRMEEKKKKGGGGPHQKKRKKRKRGGRENAVIRCSMTKPRT